MDNNSILNGFQYTFAIMSVLLVLVFWQVYFVQRLKINMLQLEHESGLSGSTIEGMGGASDVYGQSTRFLQKHSGQLATPGFVKGFVLPEQQKSGFFGGSEPPVFYDIGNIQADRDIRSKGNYSIVQKDGRGVLTEGGGPGMDYYRSGSGAVIPCPSAKHRTAADGLSCYIPEGMADPLAITTGGFGQDPFVEIEDSVYGG